VDGVVPPPKWKYGQVIQISKGEEKKTGFSKKNGVFWDVTPCGSCKNRRFGGT
jgi:hypothetical protein